MSMLNPISDSCESWEMFLDEPDEPAYESHLPRVSNVEMIANSDWIDNLINDNAKSFQTQQYRHVIDDGLDDRCVDIFNFDPEETTENEVLSISQSCGDVERIDLTHKSAGRMSVTFFDVRSAYLMIRSTIRVRGFNWMIQFSCQKVNQNLRKDTIVLFRVPNDVTDEMLTDKFSRFGDICKIRKRKSLRFIEFWDIRSSANAIRETNGETMFGRKVLIELSRPDDRRRNVSFCAKNRQPTVARMQKSKKGTVTIHVVGTPLAHRSVATNQDSKSTAQHLILTIVPKQSTISAEMHLLTSRLEAF
jgi:RNA recognition motif-containing protein